MKDSLRRESVVHIQDDSDPYWFNNPQYRLTVDDPTEVGEIACCWKFTCCPWIVDGTW